VGIFNVVPEETYQRLLSLTSPPPATTRAARGSSGAEDRRLLGHGHGHRRRRPPGPRAAGGGVRPHRFRARPGRAARHPRAPAVHRGRRDVLDPHLPGREEQRPLRAPPLPGRSRAPRTATTTSTPDARRDPAARRIRPARRPHVRAARRRQHAGEGARRRGHGARDRAGGASRKLEDLRDPHANYNAMPVGGLARLTPSIRWREFSSRDT